MARRMAERRMPARFTRYWVPALFYVTLIFVVSAQPRLHVPFSFSNADKLMHTMEYSGLGILLGRAWGGMLRPSRPLVIALAAICCGIVIGTLDELFQSTVPGRVCSPYDLAADTFGLVIGQLVYRVFTRG